MSEVSRLVEKLPRAYKAFRGRGKELQLEFEFLRDEIKKKAPSEKGSWQDMALPKVQIAQVATLQIKIILFVDQVLHIARKVREAAETLYRYCRYVSYGLYVVGWGLALFARLHGIRLIGGE